MLAAQLRRTICLTSPSTRTISRSRQRPTACAHRPRICLRQSKARRHRRRCHPPRTSVFAVSPARQRNSARSRSRRAAQATTSLCRSKYPKRRCEEPSTSSRGALFDLRIVGHPGASRSRRLQLRRHRPRLPETPAVGRGPDESKVEPSRLRQIRLGGGFEFDEIKTDIHGLAGWDDRNFLGGLRTFSVEFRPGGVFYPTRLDNFVKPTNFFPKRSFASC